MDAAGRGVAWFAMGSNATTPGRRIVMLRLWRVTQESAMKVPMRDVAAEIRDLRPEIDRAIAGVLDSARFIGGPEVEAFEKELASAAGAEFAIGVSSGTDALLVSLMALGIGPGDEVVTTPFSFFATAGVVSRLGATPVFADIDEDSLNLDPERARAAVSPRTRAIMAASLFGRPADLPEPEVDVDGVEIPVIEDAAQSLGAVPPRSPLVASSFFPAKNLGGLGDGGAVLTNDARLAELVRTLRSHGARPKYYHAHIGGNFRLDALQAAALRVKLPRLPEWIAARRGAAERYRAMLAQVDLPDDLHLPAHTPEHTYNQFVIRAPRRDALRSFLAEAGIATAIYYPLPLHLQRCYADLGHDKGAFPVAEKAATDVLALPIGPFLPAEKQSYVVDAIARFYAS